MAEIKQFKPKPKEEFTKFTHDKNGDLLPEGSGSILAKVDETTDPDNHLVGEGKCQLCGHVEKRLAIPVGATPLECPSCLNKYMVLVRAPAPKKVWVCRCGCDTFYLTTTLPMCTACGNLTQDWANS